MTFDIILQVSKCHSLAGLCRLHDTRFLSRFSFEHFMFPHLSFRVCVQSVHGFVCINLFVCVILFFSGQSIDLFSLELSKIYYNNKAINGQQQLECNGTFIVEINWRPIFRSNWIYPFTQCQQICIFEWNVDDTIWLGINPKLFRDFCHFFDNYFKRNT